jgi:hypothetical protein
MKALQLNAKWQPKASYPLSENEKTTRKVQSGSSVWKDPTIEVTTLADPVLNADEVMLQVAAVGICGSDMHMYEADKDGYMLYPGLTRFPNILGHEFSGRVVEVGDNVPDLEVGDLVTVEEIQWCGLCDACRKGLVNHCTNMEELGFTTPGAMAEFIAVKAKYCWKISELAERLGDETEALLLAAMVEPTGVSYHAMFNRISTWKPGNYCAVFGGGPIGLAAIALAKAAGASQIMAFDISQSRLEMARKMGATSTYDPRTIGDVDELFLDLTYGRGVDFVVEAAGAPEHTLAPLKMGLGVGATITQIGRSERPTPLSLEHYQVRGVQVVGSLGHAGHGTFPNVIRLMASGNLDMKPMISATMPLSDALAAFKRLEKREDAKIMLLPQGN